MLVTFVIRLAIAFESDHHRLLSNFPPAGTPTSSSLTCFLCRNPFVEVCEKLLTNNHSISISHIVHYTILLCLF